MDGAPTLPELCRDQETDWSAKRLVPPSNLGGKVQRIEMAQGTLTGRNLAIRVAGWFSLGLGLAVLSVSPCRAQGSLRYEVDPGWPKPLPGNWVTGQVSGVCVDSHDHVFIVNRNDMTDKEAEISTQAPPFIEFDADGRVVNAFGDWRTVPNTTHGCTIDDQDNFWTAGNGDGVIQKYSHDGKLLLQIGRRGVVDTSDGTLKGRALNSSQTQLNMPADIAVDPANGDVYVADGYGNSRIVVFDRDGKFLRQWGHQGTKAEADAGIGGAFMRVVHCVALSNDGLVYVCDRQSDRIQVFDKMGNFRKNIWVRRGRSLPDTWGTTWWIRFSADREQKYLYLADGGDEQVKILDRASGEILSSFGRAGHQLGEFTHAHTLAVDSKDNVYVAETDWGRRVQKFKPLSP
jgi:DNA-binding beta-propeller fold protein YncE